MSQNAIPYLGISPEELAADVQTAVDAAKYTVN